MTASNKISPQDLNDQFGTDGAAVVVDVRIDDDYAQDPRLIPGSMRRPARAAAEWAGAFAGRPVVVVCERGFKISQGAAGWLAHAGARALVLDGGFRAWDDAGLPLVRQDMVPPRDGGGRTVWVSATEPTPDRLACAWMVRRCVDSTAVVMFVDADQVALVADRFAATALGEGAGPWGSFQGALAATGLDQNPMSRLAEMLDARSPEAAGLRAVVEGQAGLLADDHARLEAALSLFDALAHRARSGTGAVR